MVIAFPPSSAGRNVSWHPTWYLPVVLTPSKVPVPYLRKSQKLIRKNSRLKQALKRLVKHLWLKQIPINEKMEPLKMAGNWRILTPALANR